MPDKTYYFNPHKFCHIWFSNNPDIGINDINKLRLAAERAWNPDIELNLLYSSELLSDQGKQDLKEFCNYFTITPVDIDAMTLEYPKDQEVFKLAKDELYHWEADGSGNPAAASDIVRLLRQVAENYGTYVDLDIFIAGDAPPPERQYIPPIDAAMPPLTQHNIHLQSMQQPIATSAHDNNVIIWSFDRASEKLSTETIKIIEHYQDEVIYNYDHVQAAIAKGYDILGHSMKDEDVVITQLCPQEHPTDGTIFAFRKNVKALMEQKASNNYTSMLVSIYNITGPRPLRVAIRTVLQRNVLDELLDIHINGDQSRNPIIIKMPHAQIVGSYSLCNSKMIQTLYPMANRRTWTDEGMAAEMQHENALRTLYNPADLPATKQLITQLVTEERGNTSLGD